MGCQKQGLDNMLRSKKAYFLEIADEFADINSESLKEIVDAVLDEVRSDLGQRHYAVYHTSNYTKTLDCGCEISLELEDFDNVSSFKDTVPDLEVTYCDDHESAPDFEESCRSLAFDIWLKDPEARYKPKYRDLFKLVGI